MANPVFDGVADAVFTSLKETERAMLTSLPAIGDGPPLTQAVDVVFSAKHVDTEYGVRGGRVPFGEPRPVAWVKAADVDPIPKYGDNIEVSGKLYFVAESTPDSGLQIHRMTLQEMT